MKSKTDATNTFPPMKIEEIDNILLNALDAYKIHFTRSLLS
nr:hypothetical protein [Bacillus pumilus]